MTKRDRTTVQEQDAADASLLEPEAEQTALVSANDSPEDEQDDLTESMEVDREVFLAELANLRNQKHTYARELDKALLTYSASALGLAITLGATSFEQPIWICAVIGSWILFCLSFGFTLVGYRIAQEQFTQAEKDLLIAVEERRMPEEEESDLLDWSSYFAIGCFLGGAIALGLFIALNMFN